MRVANWESSSAVEQRKLLARPALAKDSSAAASVAAIIERVRRDGDAALLDLTAKLDGVRLKSLEVGDSEIDESGARLSPAQREAIEAAARNIETFHRLQLPTPIAVETAPGVRCERVSRPIESVGLYVPAGSAPLPSTALMLGVPARLAGCDTRVLCSPPQADGHVHAAVLYAARVTRVQRVFKLGGAQAVAALAYGTETVPKVDKIFGPGNTWVTEAKAQVDRDPAGAARDYPAGPSEVLVIADASANAAFVASDLLSQAEHGVDSQVLLLTTSAELAAAVVAQIDEQKALLTRRAIVDGALASSSAIVVADLPTAFAIANRYAPEHLILQIDKPRDWLQQVRNAGSVFLGPWTPESVGDYCSGTNHVLPTYGFARRYSSLGVGDFLRSMTVQELTAEGIENIGPIATTLAELEGLDAHASAVNLRLHAAAGARR
jgi:histidinol dehydrogenase